MRKLTILIGLLLGSFLLHAQTYHAVMVLDSKDGSPISGASIKIKPGDKIITTSESGNAVIFASPEDSLQISFKGYKDRVISMANQPLAISIVMVATPKVVATKPKKKKH